MKNTYLQKLINNIKSIPYDYDKSLNGLGGWMVVFIIGHFLSIIGSIIGIAEIYNYVGIDKQIDTFITITFVLTAIEMILVAISIYFIFKLNILFRKIFVYRVVIGLAFTVGLAIYMYNLFGEVDTTQIISNIVSVAIWVTYVYRSKRVKNTFIYPYCWFAVEDANKAIDVENV